MSDRTPGQGAYEALEQFAADGRWLTCTDDGRLDPREELLAVKHHARQWLALAARPDGTLRARITHLAETWEAHPELTAEGEVMRDLGQVLRDELGHASDRGQDALRTLYDERCEQLAVTRERLRNQAALTAEVLGSFVTFGSHSQFRRCVLGEEEFTGWQQRAEAAAAITGAGGADGESYRPGEGGVMETGF